LTSQQQQITSSLFASQLDPTTGQVVDQYDLPTAIVNPNFAVQNEVSRSKRYSLNLSTTVEPNHFLVFGTYERRTSLSATTPTATSIGIHFDWLRDIRPNLTGRIGFGYTISSDLSVFAPTNPTVITTVSNTDMISGDLSLIYLFNDNLIGSILYNIYYQSNRPSLTASNTIAIGNILTNRLTFSLTKTF
jgi:hypothetical protein